MQFNSEVLEKIKNSPSQPGVYFFKNLSGETIYIGKAKNLKNRLKSYLNKVTQDWKFELLFKEAFFLEFKTTNDELEALILEAKLIKANQPKLNVLLKSGNPFVYFFFSKPEKNSVSSFQITRNTNKKGVYFGPFLSGSQARLIYETFVKIFSLRACKRKVSGGCLYFHMGQCSGFCKEDFDKKEYEKKIFLLKKLCQGGPKKFASFLKKEIKLASEKLEFEKAEKLNSYFELLKESFDQLENVNSISHLKLEKFINKQIWIYFQDSHQLYLFSYSSGDVKKQGIFDLSLSFFEKESPEEFIFQFYQKAVPPEELFFNFDFKNKAVFEGFLKKWHNLFSPVVVSKVSKNLDFSQLCLELAKKEELKRKSLPERLKKLLGLKKSVKTIDCFDVSHHQGHFSTGSCVRFNLGVPDKKLFRHFKIRWTKGIDDYKALREIVYRRYSGDFDFKNFPDLVLIDGGKGQLNAVKDLFENLEFASLAKREEEVFRPNISKPILKLSQKTQEGVLLTSIRDYAHHLAISFHRKLKTKIES